MIVRQIKKSLFILFVFSAMPLNLNVRSNVENFVKPAGQSANHKKKNADKLYLCGKFNLKQHYNGRF
jgi:hypothetical protein